jgi:hypothetical protein
MTKNKNALMVIAPYWYKGTWVFDDEAAGLVREPFVLGMPEIIDAAVEDIPKAEKGFRLTFSAQPFPGANLELTWEREEHGGHWYCSEQTEIVGWLCPALFAYFDEAPKKIYAKAEPLSRDRSV